MHLLLLKTITFYTQEIADPDIHVPKVDCFVCGKVIRMDELTQHQESHSPTTNGCKGMLHTLSIALMFVINNQCSVDGIDLIRTPMLHRLQ